MAGAMGWSAADIAEASLWQLLAAFDGYRRANSPPDEEGLTDTESDALWAAVQGYDAQPAGEPVGADDAMQLIAAHGVRVLH